MRSREDGRRRVGVGKSVREGKRVRAGESAADGEGEEEEEEEGEEEGVSRAPFGSQAAVTSQGERVPRARSAAGTIGCDRSADVATSADRQTTMKPLMEEIRSEETPWGQLPCPG